MMAQQFCLSLQLQSRSIVQIMFENLALRGLLSLLGAFLISLAVGVNYLWGIITIYGTSYFRIASKDATLTEDQTDIVFPLMLLGQAISIPFVTRYAKKVSSGMTCFVSGIVMSFVMYFASYTQNFSTFAALFGLGNGIIIGVLYILPIGHCYQFFPKKKTMISVFIISASGIGTLIFAFIALDSINFENLSLQAAGVNLYYGKEIAERFPQYLKIMSGVTLAFVSGGGLLLFEYPAHLESTLKKELLASSENKSTNLASLMDLQFQLDMEESKEQQKNPFGNMNYELTDMGKNYEKGGIGKVYGERGEHMLWPALQQSENEYQPPKNNDHHNQTKSEPYAKEELPVESVNQCPRTSDGPRECIFWMLFAVMVLGSNFGLMMSVNYRTFIKDKIMDDKYLTLIGSVGAIACSMSRFLWGALLEKSTFKAIYYCLCVLNAILAFSIPYIAEMRQVYFVYIVLSYICYGGHLGIFPAITSVIFGVRYGPQIYGILYYALPVSNFIQYLLVNYIESGYLTIFKISGVMSICALLIVKRLELTYDWSVRIREHNERKRLMAR